MRTLEEEAKRQGFNLQVTYRDEKGKITHSDPYTLRVIKEGSGKMKLWERPAGSGNLWNKQGEPIGRWVEELVDHPHVKGKKVKKGKYVPGAEHIEFDKPLTEDEKLSKELLKAQTRNEELQKELEAIMAEKKKVQDAVPVQSAAKKSTKGA